MGMTRRRQNDAGVQSAENTMRRAIFALIFAATAASAEVRQHGNVIFDLPAGWFAGAVRDDGTLTLLTDFDDDEGCRFCYAYVATGTSGEMPIDRYLQSQATFLLDEDDEETPKILTGPEVLTSGGRPAGIMGQTVGDTLQVLLAVQLSDRLELIAFAGEADDETEVQASMDTFLRDIVPMFENARFVSEGATPLMPPPQPGPLGGLWWGFGTSWGIGLDGMMQMSLDHRHLVFWPDGTFYDGTPPDGLAGLDQDALLRDGDMEWGSYALTGNTLRLSYASGEVEDLTKAGDGLEDGLATLFQVETLPDGAPLQGSISDFNYTGFTPGMVIGGVALGGEAVFRPDGSWSEERWANASGSFDSNASIAGGFATSSENAKSGNYRVRDGLVTQYRQGREIDRNWAFRVDGDIMIGTATLE